MSVLDPLEIADYQLPVAKARFQPRNQGSVLSQIVQSAAHRYVTELFPQAERESVAATVRAHLDSTPADDLAVLRRYGFTETVERASVMIYNPETQHYDQRTSVRLPAPLEVPKGAYQVTVNAPRYSEWPDNGITESYRAELAQEGKLESFLADQVEREARYLPRDLDAWATRILEGRAFERGAYRTATGWPAEYRAEHGKWPTWVEIEMHFAFIGAYLAERRGQVAAAGHAESVVDE